VVFCDPLGDVGFEPAGLVRTLLRQTINFTLIVLCRKFARSLFVAPYREVDVLELERFLVESGLLVDT